MTTSHHPGRINLKLRELAQLFNSMDPSPFFERDLDHDAEEFIVGWARELPHGHSLELAIHVAVPPEPERLHDLEAAVQHYFANRAEMKRREFRLLLRRGHASLAIGLLFLSACLVGSGMTAALGHGPIAPILREGLLIVGWVAMWRPLEIYLYDWWPVRAGWKILRRLARMHVRVVWPPDRHATKADPHASRIPPPATIS